MRDTFNSNNAGDFHQRYGDTFGWLHVPGQSKVFVHVAEVNDDTVAFKQGGAHKFHVNIDSGIEFEFIPVDRGWYTNVHGELRYLQRKPARQWRRGIAHSNTEMFDAQLLQLELSYSELRDVFDGGQAVDPTNLTSVKDINVRLSKHFAVAYNTVYFYTIPVAFVEGNGAALRVVEPLVLQELADLIRRNKHQLEITQ